MERVQAKINSIVAAQPDRYGYLLDAAADRQVTDEERDRAAAAHRRQLALDDAQYMRQQVSLSEYCLVTHIILCIPDRYCKDI